MLVTLARAPGGRSVASRASGSPRRASPYTARSALVTSAGGGGVVEDRVDGVARPTTVRWYCHIRLSGMVTVQAAVDAPLFGVS